MTQTLSRFSHQFRAMGSPCELHIYANNKKAFQKISHVLQADILRLEHKYSRYQNDSFLSDINRVAEEGGEINVDDETARLLDYAFTCYQQSDGLFDISSGKLRKIWRFNHADFQLPSAAEIEKALQSIGLRKVLWSNPTIKFFEKNMELDFGGIVKEYAADRMASLAKSHGFEHGLVNLGGDIKIIGPHPDDSPWQIGIRDPLNTNAICKTVLLKQGALASSGDYERCVVIDSKRYSHILNPKTGRPVNYFSAVTVISQHCVLAGSAATIAMLKEQAGSEWLNQLTLPHLWIDIQGNQGGSLLN